MSTNVTAVPAPKVIVAPLAPLWLGIAGVLGALGGLALWLNVDPVYKIPSEYRVLPDNMTIEQFDKAMVVIRAINIKNFGIDYALIGLAIGVAMGLLTGGQSRIKGTLLSGALGAICGWLGGVACITGMYTAYEARGNAVVLFGMSIDPIIVTLLSHAAGWGLAGVGAGFGLCLARGGWLYACKGALGGAVGGLATGMAFTVISAYFFPIAESFAIMPETLFEQLLWAVEGGSLVGLCIALATGSRTAKGS